MYPNILTDNQKELLPKLEQFTQDYFLVGGTAIALQIGHRKSIDYDLFTYGSIKPKSIKKWIESLPYDQIKIIHEDGDQIHLIILDVRITFFSFPFKIDCVNNIHGLPVPSLLTLAAMKAFALGRRAKWKDYVDLYFIMKDYHALKMIIKEADNLFLGQFIGRLFRQQLRYFNDIDYSEPVEYLVNPVSVNRIKDFLSTAATDPF